MPKFYKECLSEGKSVWLKIAGGAVATPVVVIGSLLKSNRRSPRDEMGTSVPELIAFGIGAVVVGAILGACLSLKDTVEKRIRNNQSCPFPLVLLFGKGGLSLLVWCGLAFLGAIVFVAYLAAATTSF